MGRLIAGLLLVLVLLAGCASKPKYLGTWKSSLASITLDSDGTMVIGAPVGGGRGRWQDQGDGVIATQLDQEKASRLSKWWVSEDGRTLTLAPLQEDGSAGQPVVYTRQ